jgi:hypothetical protein
MPFSRRSRRRRPAPPTDAQSAPSGEPSAESSADAPQRVVLRFDGGRSDEDPPQEDLSAVAVTGDALWLAGDEGTSLERLVREADGGFGARTRFPLADLVDLPGADDGEEVDVEGIDVADGWLWVVGSHASARRAADPSDDDVKAQLERLATVRGGDNRHLLARIPVVRGADGQPALVRDDGARCAARLRGGRGWSALTRALRRDAHLGPSFGMPSKENGLDVEGLAVVGSRLYVGLRGPVLRGMAVILELEPRPRKRRPDRLKLARVGPGGRRYRKHFLDLCGLGVRDLCVDGDDVLILAGPTMTLDGRCVVFRWTGAAAAARDDDVPRADTLVGDDALEVALELPYGAGADEEVEHPEGIAFVADAAGRRGLLVVHDAPAEHRRRGAHAIEADLYFLE